MPNISLADGARKDDSVIRQVVVLATLAIVQ